MSDDRLLLKISCRCGAWAGQSHSLLLGLTPDGLPSLHAFSYVPSSHLQPSLALPLCMSPHNQSHEWLTEASAISLLMSLFSNNLIHEADHPLSAGAQ